MTVFSSLNRVTCDLIPSDGVVVVLPAEAGYEGYVSREVPTNGDEVFVNITKSPASNGSRLSYKRSSQGLTRRNGK